MAKIKQLLKEHSDLGWVFTVWCSNPYFVNQKLYDKIVCENGQKFQNSLCSFQVDISEHIDEKNQIKNIFVGYSQFLHLWGNKINVKCKQFCLCIKTNKDTGLKCKPQQCPCCKKEIYDMSQHMRLWYLSHSQAMKAQASLHKCEDWPGHSLLTYTKYGY